MSPTKASGARSSRLISSGVGALTPPPLPGWRPSWSDLGQQRDAVRPGRLPGPSKGQPRPHRSTPRTNALGHLPPEDDAQRCRLRARFVDDRDRLRTKSSGFQASGQSSHGHAPHVCDGMALRRGRHAERLGNVELDGQTYDGHTLRELLAHADTAVTLTRCDLSAVDLRDADLTEVSFQECALDNADLRGAALGGSSFVGCRLMGADFEGVGGFGFCITLQCLCSEPHWCTDGARRFEWHPVHRSRATRSRSTRVCPRRVRSERC